MTFRYFPQKKIATTHHTPPSTKPSLLATSYLRLHLPPNHLLSFRLPTHRFNTADVLAIKIGSKKKMSPLSITVARRLHHNTPSICRSLPLSIDAATTCFSTAKRDDDDTKQTQSIRAPNHNIITSATTTTVRYYSCHPHISPLHHSSTNNNNSIAKTFLLNKREYHSTSRTEILPFIAVGVLGATTIYTYRALEQMDKEWDDYYDKVEEYKAKTGIDPEKESLTMSNQKIESKKEENDSS